MEWGWFMTLALRHSMNSCFNPDFNQRRRVTDGSSPSSKSAGKYPSWQPIQRRAVCFRVHLARTGTRWCPAVLLVNACWFMVTPLSIGHRPPRSPITNPFTFQPWGLSPAQRIWTTGTTRGLSPLWLSARRNWRQPLGKSPRVANCMLTHLPSYLTSKTHENSPVYGRCKLYEIYWNII